MHRGPPQVFFKYVTELQFTDFCEKKITKYYAFGLSKDSVTLTLLPSWFSGHRAEVLESQWVRIVLVLFWSSSFWFQMVFTTTPKFRCNFLKDIFTRKIFSGYFWICGAYFDETCSKLPFFCPAGPIFFLRGWEGATFVFHWSFRSVCWWHLSCVVKKNNVISTMKILFFLLSFFIIATRMRFNFFFYFHFLL